MSFSETAINLGWVVNTTLAIITPTVLVRAAKNRDY